MLGLGLLSLMLTHVVKFTFSRQLQTECNHLVIDYLNQGAQTV
ncbi:MAG: hypothetical protein ACI9WC_003132 [Arenicella sp.]|jgi:hypothetical protein